jgi:ADP-dependent phosphofructokinase/glucokinase
MKNVHFEFANFYDPEFFNHMYTTQFKYFNSLGINEQEIGNLVNYIKTGHLSDIGDAKPTITSSIGYINQLLEQMKG